MRVALADLLEELTHDHKRDAALREEPPSIGSSYPWRLPIPCIMHLRMDALGYSVGGMIAVNVLRAKTRPSFTRITNGLYVDMFRPKCNA